MSEARRFAGAMIAAAIALALAGCGDAGRTVAPDDGGADGATTQEGGGDAGLVLTSSAFQDQGTLPVDYTCDGAGTSPPLAWTGVPAGTVELALLMTTIAPDRTKWNWVLYHIPVNVSALPEAASGIGTAGLTSDGPLLQYSPPCSQGPGPKQYTFTLYALSGVPTFAVPADQVTGQVVTDAIGGLTLASSSITVTYTR